MLKKILNVKGAQKLSKREQEQVSGGSVPTTCNTDSDCIIPGEPFCIYACIDTGGGNKQCVYDNLTCFGGLGG